MAGPATATSVNSQPATATTTNTKKPTSNTAGFEEAANIANSTIKWIKQQCKAGSSVRQLIQACHEHIKELKGEQAFPCSISVNDILCHCSPTGEENDVVLVAGDVAKVELGVRVDDCPCLVCTTVVVGVGGLGGSPDGAEGLVAAAQEACKALIQCFQADTTTNALTAVDRFHKHFYLPPNTQYIEGMMSHRLDRGALSTDDILVIRPVEGQNKMVSRRPFQAGDIWAVDVAVSDTATGTAKTSTAPLHRTAIFAKSGSNAPLRLQASRTAFSKTTTRYGLFGFNQQQFAECAAKGCGVKAALGECVGKGVLVPYDYLQVVPDAGCAGKIPKAARFLATIMITTEGPKLLTDPFSS